MIITEITEDNIGYFAVPRVKELFDKRPHTEGVVPPIFLGLVDDEDRAVGTAVIETGGDTGRILYFGIADEFRHRGYGRYFMDGIEDMMRRIYVRRLYFTSFLPEGEEKDMALTFLSRLGFILRQGVGRRRVYDMASIKAADSFAMGKLPKGTAIIRPAQAGDLIRDRVLEIAADMEEKDMYLDDRVMLSEENRYGGLMVKGNEVTAMISVLPFDSDVLLEGLYASDLSSGDFLHLFDHALKMTAFEESAPAHLYVDTADEKLMRFEDALMKKKGIVPVRELYGAIAEKVINRDEERRALT